jgi:hypothetical protein
MSPAEAPTPAAPTPAPVNADPANPSSSFSFVSAISIVLLSAMRLRFRRPSLKRSQIDDSGRQTTQFPNLPHDLQSQLGLKLVPDHVKMPYLVVEHAAAPTAN